MYPNWLDHILFYGIRFDNFLPALCHRGNIVTLRHCIITYESLVFQWIVIWGKKQIGRVNYDMPYWMKICRAVREPGLIVWKTESQTYLQDQLYHLKTLWDVVYLRMIGAVVKESIYETLPDISHHFVAKENEEGVLKFSISKDLLKKYDDENIWLWLKQIFFTV